MDPGLRALLGAAFGALAVVLLAGLRDDRARWLLPTGLAVAVWLLSLVA